MKKIRIILSMLAVVLAIGGAIASSFAPPLTVAYEFINTPGDPKCKAHSVTCETNNTGIPCTVTGVSQTLRMDSTPNCGQELWKTP